MKKYWLYIESFTFIFRGRQGYLFFNSISNHSFLIPSRGSMSNFIEQIIEPEQMYCIEVSEDEIDKYKLLPLIKSLRETFTGDLLSKEMIRKKPVALYPKFSVMKSIEHLKHHPENSVGQNLLNYLHELNIFITGKCLLNCNSCSTYIKQVTICTKSSDELNIIVLRELLQNTLSTSLYKINFLGGDIFNYSQWKELCLLLENLPFHVKFYSHFQNILLNYEKMKHISKNITFSVVIPAVFSKSKLVNSLKLLERNNLKFELTFFITSDIQYSEAITFCKEESIESYLVLPIFTDSNEVFFQQNVFMDAESILSVPSSKKEIFSRMALNTNDFGRLYIMSNGDVFANVNAPKLGNINNCSLYEILYSEIIEGKNWLKIRDQEPCNQCVYQWLCPSPSNYEYVFGKYNLCKEL